MNIDKPDLAEARHKDLEEGIALGEGMTLEKARQEKLHMVHRMRERGMDAVTICDFTGLSAEELEEMLS